MYSRPAVGEHVLCHRRRDSRDFIAAALAATGECRALRFQGIGLSRSDDRACVAVTSKGATAGDVGGEPRQFAASLEAKALRPSGVPPLHWSTYRQATESRHPDSSKISCIGDHQTRGSVRVTGTRCAQLVVMTMTETPTHVDVIGVRLDRLSGHLASAAVGLGPEMIDAIITDALRQVCEVLDADFATLESLSEDSSNRGLRRTWIRHGSATSAEPAVTIRVSVSGGSNFALLIGMATGRSRGPQLLPTACARWRT